MARPPPLSLLHYYIIGLFKHPFTVGFIQTGGDSNTSLPSRYEPTVIDSIGITIGSYYYPV